MLFQAMPVLDHGFVRVIDYMGDDAAIVQAARVSYGRGTRRVSEDAGLIRYLMRHRHSTPFEMCEIKYHVKLPIFVARQWIRHRTANVNEYSARYSILDREFYIPAPEHLAAQSVGQPPGPRRCAGRRRGGAGARPAARGRDALLRPLRRDAERGRGGRAARSVAPGPGARAGADEPDAEHLYAVVLEDRPVQPASTSCRCAPMRMRSTKSASMPRRCWTRSRPGCRWRYQAFLDYRLGAVTLSAQMLAVVRRMLAGEAVEQANSGLNRREWAELMASLGRA